MQARFRRDRRIAVSARRWSVLLAVTGSVGVAAAGFLPWGASGRAERSSYALVGVVDRLEVLDGAEATLIRIWYLAPIAAATVWLAAALGRRGVAAGVAAPLALTGVVFAEAVRRSPLLGRPGPYATMAAAAVALAGVALTLIERGRSDRTP